MVSRIGSVAYIILFNCALSFAQNGENEVAQTSEINQRFYAGAVMGIADYSGTEHVQGQWVRGLHAGYRFQERIHFEFSYWYSQYNLTATRCSSLNCSQYIEPIDVALNQHDLALGAKYILKQESVRPFVGLSLHYVMRNFENKRDYYRTTSSGTVMIGSLPGSRAVNLGLNVGAEAQFLKSIFLIGQVGYLTPINYRLSGSPQDEQLSGNLQDTSRPIEQLNQFFLLASLSFAIP